MFVGEHALETIAAQRREIDRAEALWLRNVFAYDRSGVWSDAGYLHAGAALRDACGLSPGAAHATIVLARKLDAMPQVAAAFAAGVISRKHVEVLAAAYTPERASGIAQLEAPLVDAAQVTNPQQFRQIVRQYTDAIDHDRGAATDEKLYERRRLHASVTLDGMVAIDGLLDPESGEIVMSALDDRDTSRRTLPQITVVADHAPPSNDSLRLSDQPRADGW